MGKTSELSEAVILAGGKGTRLRPYTTTLPKPLMPVGEKPILEIVLKRLRRAGVKKSTLACYHQVDIIMAFFGKGEKIGMEIEYAIEETPLGTVGPLKKINDLPENFLVMNGDVLSDINYQALFSAHLESGAELTIATHRRENKIDYGVIEIDAKSSRITGFREKPIYNFDVSMGIYVFSRSVLDLVPLDTMMNFDELVLEMLAKNRKIFAYQFDGYWLDIGRPDDYDKANMDFESGKINFDI